MNLKPSWHANPMAKWPTMRASCSINCAPTTITASTVTLRRHRSVVRPSARFVPETRAPVVPPRRVARRRRSVRPCSQSSARRREFRAPSVPTRSPEKAHRLLHPAPAPARRSRARVKCCRRAPPCRAALRPSLPRRPAASLPSRAPPRPAGSSCVTGASSFGIICSIAQSGPFCRISSAFFSRPARPSSVSRPALVSISTSAFTRSRQRRQNSNRTYPPTEHPTKAARPIFSSSHSRSRSAASLGIVVAPSPAPERPKPAQIRQHQPEARLQMPRHRQPDSCDRKDRDAASRHPAPRLSLHRTDQHHRFAESCAHSNRTRQIRAAHGR